ncbi:S9 family peptidase [Pseudenhygromyxa sp. WMMC2535]|uniref:S9 family peptidase n=1 Tax=Pseudenhygromyxa sp. WMMC2535 TaxID=2712867 RepID=UPI00155176A4|nr:S9 family peptidase [Pseudenhygromyxa sp. WMMC2535]NVB38487.1 S9 family peptidase [Pseudenhygromyxa sp. WMMC2535]
MSEVSEAPRPERRPQRRTLFGDTCVDEYAWLREREDPAVRAHVEAERAHAEAVLEARTGELRERLYAGMRGRMKEDDGSVPAKDGPWLYYSRTEEGDEYPRHCRRAWSPGRERLSLAELEAAGVPEQLYLDENALADGHEYFDLAGLALTPSHARCAYSVDLEGDEVYTLRFADLPLAAHLDDVLEGCGASAVWLDERTLLYLRLDERHRPWQLWRHVLGEDQADDALVFQEDDERFYLSIHRTRSEAYVVLSADANDSSEVWLIPCDAPGAEPRLVAAREPKVEYDVGHRGQWLFVRSNRDAENFQLLLAPLPAGPARAQSSAAQGSWATLIPHREDVLLEDVDVFRGHMVVWERAEGLQRLRVVPLEPFPEQVGLRDDGGPGEEHLVAFPDPTYSIWPGLNDELDTSALRLGYSSLTTPASVLEYGLEDGQMRVRKRVEVVGGHEPGDYASARLWARAKDGERVPISLVWRRAASGSGARGPSLERPGEACPLILSGYGAYGAASDPAFSSARLSLLRRGAIWAIAHVRGGDELGRRWYEAGKLANKQNTFDDFIACAEHLCAEGWTSPEQLAATGGSAGGLLIGAVANARPALFTAMVADVPFVDVLNTMLDESLPLTALEWDEWGNPALEAGYRWIRAYSPYDNVRAQAYPDMLVLAGWNDPRVGYWEAAKWVARLRERKTDAREILLWTNMGAGHMGASGRFEFLRELAIEYAFLIDRLGLPQALSVASQG